MTEKPILFTPWSVRRILAGAKTRTMRPMKPSEYLSPLTAKFAKYAVGDSLWIREPWHCAIEYDAIAPRNLPEEPGVWFEAGSRSGDIAKLVGRLRPGMFLPKRFARSLRLPVTSVKVQRPRDLTVEEMVAEGVECNALQEATWAWEKIWTGIYGAASWEANPWCFVYSGPWAEAVRDNALQELGQEIPES